MEKLRRVVEVTPRKAFIIERTFSKGKTRVLIRSAYKSNAAGPWLYSKSLDMELDEFHKVCRAMNLFQKDLNNV